MADPLGFDTLTLTASYSPRHDLPAPERTHLEFDFRHLGWDCT